MADVQLEHGYLRIANALDEAITYAEFTGTEHKIVRVLVRLTFGWNKRTVRLSVAVLAEKCHMANTGGFRRALDRLLAEGVIIERESACGSRAPVYEVNKNFEDWGKLSVPARTLERQFGSRPEHADKPSSQLPPQGQETDDQQLPLEGQENTENQLPPQGQENAGVAPHRGNSTAPTGATGRPHRGNRTPLNSNDSNAFQRRKDTIPLKDSKSGKTGPLRSLSLTELLEPIDGTAAGVFFDKFYAQSDSERRLDVAGQLHLLNAGGSVPDAEGHHARAYSVDRLNAKCADVCSARLRDPDKAILVLLRKLGDTSDVADDLLTRELAGIDESTRIGRERERRAAAWSTEHPDEAAELRAQLEQQIPGSGPLVGESRHWAFVAEVTQLLNRQPAKAS